MSHLNTNEVHSICQRSLNPDDEGNLFDYIAGKLRPFNGTQNYIPLDRVEEMGIKDIWPFLYALWMTEYFSEFRTMSEYEFLMGQLYAGNPWARLRLGYLLAKEELSEQPEHFEFGYDSAFFGLSKVPDKESQCFSAAMIEENTKFNIIGSITGLSRSLDLNYADKLLGHREIDSLWEDIRQEVHDKGKQLFNEQRDDQYAYYQLMDKINNHTIADRAAYREVESIVGNIGLDERANSELESIYNSEEGLRGDFFMGLYRLRGNMDEQVSYYTNYLQENDISEDLDIKYEFTKLDNDIKKSIYKSLLRESALKRRAKLLEQLDQVCKFSPDNHDELKTFFYMNAKAQNQLNELTGLPAVPEEVMKRLEGWTGEDWENLRDGVLAGVLGIGAVIAATACTASVVCGVAAAAAAGAIFFQARLVVYEYQKMTESKIHTERIRRMEELGLTDIGNNRQMRHGWFMLAFEAVSIIPILGVSMRGAQIGGRLIKSLPVLRQAGLRGYKEAVTAANEMSDVRYAMTILKDGLSDQQLSALKVIEEKTAGEIKDVISQHNSGLISRIRMDELLHQIKNNFLNKAKTIGDDFLHQLDDITVTLSKEQVDELTATQITRYHGSLKNFSREFKAISGKKVEGAIARMEEKLPEAKGINAWFIKMRSEHLYQYRESIALVKKNLEEAMASGKSFDDFVRENIGDLTNIYARAPFKKRTLPHMILVQGANHGTEFGLGRSQQLLGGVADSLLTKKIFQARARLLVEIYRREAKAALDLPEIAGSLKTYKVFKAFNQKIVDRLGDTASNLTRAQRSEMLSKYKELQEAATREVWDSYLAKRGANGQFKIGNETYNLTEDQVKRILFSPRNIKEEVLAEKLWAQLDVHKILGMEELPEFAHLAAKNLSNYKNVGDYEDFLSALRVLVMKNKPEVVDFM
jgi:hypothetical protein